MQLNERIFRSAKLFGNNLSDITVVCATKTRDIETVKSIRQMGFCIAGENKVQELLQKHQEIDGISWHFVGQLQTNKVKQLVSKVDMIQSVDRMSLAEEISKHCCKINKQMAVLIQVNLTEDSGRGGVQIDEAESLLHEVIKLPNIDVQGFMAVLPKHNAEEAASKMRTLFDKVREKNSNFRFLSMGMSDDFELALAHGANMIRLGKILFGERL